MKEFLLYLPEMLTSAGYILLVWLFAAVSSFIPYFFNKYKQNKQHYNG